MEIKTNKTYYKVKKNYSGQYSNYRTIIEYDDYERAKQEFEIYQKGYLVMSKEQQTNYTYYLCACINGDEDVLAYFGMGLEFNGRPFWVSKLFSKD